MMDDKLFNLHSLASLLQTEHQPQGPSLHRMVQDLFKSLTPLQCENLSRKWSFWARPDQRPPEFLPNGKPWQYWLFLAGRGAGKTRSGAEWVREQVQLGYKHIGLIAPTTADIRDVMIEGSSGILSVSWDKDVDARGQRMGRPTYEPSKRHRLTWANGATCHGYSAEEPDRLRGPQHEKLWCDELAAWQYAQETWDMAMFGLRLGNSPQAMVSTTPRPIPIVRELTRSPLTVITRSSTYANRANLAGAFLDAVVTKYEGTRLGRQELMGEILEEVEGALWQRETIAACTLTDRKPPDLSRIVISIDPAITSNATSNLTGIVAAGLGTDKHGYVIEDVSGRYTPDEWGRVAVKLFDDLKADRIVAEGNQGGDMVRHVLETVRPNIPITIVHASRSKQARAEPVAALYEQKRVFHAKPLPEMEDQMCTWEPLSGDPSPDRLDAMVWALTNLMLDAQIIPFVTPVVIGTPRNIPGQ
jgi:phage terminase large subunit-like protein